MALEGSCDTVVVVEMLVTKENSLERQVTVVAFVFLQLKSITIIEYVSATNYEFSVGP